MRPSRHSENTHGHVRSARFRTRYRARENASCYLGPLRRGRRSWLPPKLVPQSTYIQVSHDCLRSLQNIESFASELANITPRSHPKELVTDVSEKSGREIIESLYAGGVEFDANWETLDDDVLSRLREAHQSGDAALQSLLANLAFNKFETAEQAERVAASMAGIKQATVSKIFEEFPTTSLDDLRAAADRAGYDIEVLS